MKTPFRLMMIGLVATSLLASCKKNNNDNNGGTANGQGFRATTEQGAGNNTRTHIDGLNPTAGGTSQVLWDDADLITVRNNAGTVLTYQLTDGKDTPNGIFYTGEPHDNFFQPNYTAIYPATDGNTITGEGTAQFTLPATQSYVENSFAKGAMPMMAVSDNQTLPFKNVLGGLCFPIEGNGFTVTSIVLRSASASDHLCGVFNANYNSGAPALTYASGGSNVITLDCGTGVTLGADAVDFIIMVPPGMLQSGFTLTAYNGTTPIYENSTDSDPGIQRSHIVKLTGSLEVKQYTISVSANPTAGGSVTGGRTYYYGDQCTVTATASSSSYVFVNWTEGTDVVSTSATYTFTVDGNHDLVANFRENIPGIINGKYSVSATQKVYFSMGNLKYNGNGTWSFHDNQWGKIHPSQQTNSNSGTVRDLFGWGTSNYNHGAGCWRPWDTDEDNEEYYAFGNQWNNLTSYADWGYNAITNGGNTENSGWRTLTYAEWTYLLYTRPVTSGIRWTLGTVNGVGGLILLPDDWNVSYYTLNDPNCGFYNSNIITAADWTNTLEFHGAVFLPGAGNRWADWYSQNLATAGFYWSSTQKDGGDSAWCMKIMDGTAYGATANNYEERAMGASVRLVRNAN